MDAGAPAARPATALPLAAPPGVTAAARSPSLRRAWIALLQRDLRVAARRRGDVLTGLVFFVVVASLFPLGAGSEPKLLREIGAGVVWVAALLASVIALPRLFAADHADGTLEQLLLRPQPLAPLVLAKVGAHWLGSGLPLALVAPLVGLQFGMAPATIGVLVLSLVIGTPALSLLGAVGAALALGLRGGGALTALMVLPLNAPVLIFGAGAVVMQGAGLPVAPWLSLLGATSLLALAIAPWAIAAALRVACE